MNNLTKLTCIYLLTTAIGPAASAQVSLNGTPNPPADDPPVYIGNGWTVFSWQNGPNVFNNEGAFTFNSATSTILTITDTGIAGDRFTLFDNGNNIGTTSVPSNNGYYTSGLNYDADLIDPNYSHGTFALGAGAHSVTIETIQIASGYVGGAAVIRVDAAPEPSAFALVAVGAAGFSCCRRRR